MENNLLREIISVEKEIQQSLDQAKEMASAWLETSRKEIDARRAGEEKKIVDSFQQAREKLTREAAGRADALVKQAEQKAGRIVRLENDALLRIVANHIHKILPGDA